MVGLEHRHIGRDGEREQLAFVVGELRIGKLPFVGRGDAASNVAFGVFDLVAEFVVEVLVEEYLSDDFILVAIVAHAIGFASGFEGVNELDCFFAD